MTRGFRQLVTASLAMILFGGILSPSVIHAEAVTAVPTATTQAAKQTYTISSVELPYTKLIANQQVTKDYWFQKDMTSDTDGGPHALTVGQLENTGYMENFVKYNNNDDMAASLPYIYQGLYADPTIAKDTTVGEFLYTQNTEDFSSAADYIESSRLSTFITTWWLKNLAQYQINQSNYAQMQSDYHNFLRDYLVNIETPDSTMGTYDQIFTTEENFEDPRIQKMLYENTFPGLIQANYLGQYTNEQLTQLNPEISAAETERAMNQPMADFLIPQGDGTYQVSGLLMAIEFKIFSSDDALLPPTTTPEPNPNPQPTPDPEPVTSQPVTVRYVDTTGKTVAPAKTLTGDLGASYQSAALKIANYTLKTTPTNATGKFTSQAQTVTYVYQAVLTSGAGAAVVAPKGTVVYATKKIGLYRSATFTKKARKQWYAKKSRQNRPMFVVTGYAKSKNGVKRYRVKDVNHHSKTAGKTGYITANSRYTARVYYAKKQPKITVINKAGVNAYSKKSLTGKRHHYRQGQVLKVKKIVTHNLTTRFVLTNGTYVTANKKLVQTVK
ncbi:DUF5776 domain-containing protein [Levilactobacillus lanxiensis]|uniref:DUF5776 domain-containing protein n=1 Tax=Levilactobacillus lanxiensis TaxID=2799568 RepID=A0ABW4D2X5_9LACO|nr:DUF5776 domain-containing protein [Levilactobacillus lanxiensis]